MFCLLSRREHREDAFRDLCMALQGRVVVAAVQRGLGVVHVGADAPGVDEGVVPHGGVRAAVLHVVVHVRIEAAEDVADRDADAAGRDGVVLRGIVQADHDELRLRVELVDAGNDGVEVLGEHPERGQLSLRESGIELGVDHQRVDVVQRVLHVVERVEQRGHLVAKDTDICRQGLHRDHQRLGGVVDADVESDEVGVRDVVLERFPQNIELVDVQVTGVIVDGGQAQRAHAVAVVVVVQQGTQVRGPVAAVGKLMDGRRIDGLAEDVGIGTRDQVPLDFVVVVVHVIGSSSRSWRSPQRKTC